MKKLLLLFSCTLLAFLSYARDFSYEYEGQTLDYTVIDETEKTCMVKSENNVSGILKIPEEVMDGEVSFRVTAIGDYAFYRCGDLTTVDIPSSVTTIGDAAFFYCYGLTTVDIPSSVTTIGDSAFSYCTGLTTVDIPSSVTTIGVSAFSYCYGLTKVNIPSSITTIGNSAFSYCYGLTTVDIPSSVTIIGNSAFSYCYGLTKVNIPSSVTAIGDYAFYRCGDLTTVDIPSSVTTIGDAAFSYCYGLTTVNIPSSVTTIENYAFRGCYGLTTVSLPESITAIRDYAFNDCYSLTTVSIPSTVTIIGNGAFSNCSGLTTVIIPSSVTTTGRQVFYDCKSLRSVIYYESESPVNGNWDMFECYGDKDIIYENATLYIPDEAIEKCKTISPWKYFSNYHILDVDQKINVFLNSTKLSMIEGDTLSLVATVIPENTLDKAVTWTTSDAGVASVDTSGKVTAVAEGTTVITATCGSASGSCEVTVSRYIDAEEITLNVEKLRLTSVEYSLIATVSPWNTTDKTVEWTTSDAGVAAVNADGAVTPVAPGTAIITATCGSVSASCEVTVEKTECYTGLSGNEYYFDYEAGLVMQLRNNEATLVSPTNVEASEFRLMQDKLYRFAEVFAMLKVYSEELENRLEMDSQIIDRDNEIYLESVKKFMSQSDSILVEFDDLYHTLIGIYDSRVSSSPAKERRFANSSQEVVSIGIQSLMSDFDMIEQEVLNLNHFLRQLEENLMRIDEEIISGEAHIVKMYVSFDMLIAQDTEICEEISVWISENAETASPDQLEEMLVAIQQHVAALEYARSSVPDNPMNEPIWAIQIISDKIADYNAELERMAGMMEGLQVRFENSFQNFYYRLFRGMENSLYLSSENGVFQLPDVVIANDREYAVTAADGNIFAYISSLGGSKLILPKKINRIQNGAFAVNGISDINVPTSSVPSVEQDCFTADVLGNATLTVSPDLEESFRNHPVWKNFYDTTAVNMADWEIIKAVVPALKSRGWSSPWDLTGGARAAKYFKGLTINDDRVVGIDLSESYLRGEFPVELLAFLRLNTLNLYGNRFDGPVEITAAYLQQNPDAGASLTEINISGNNFSGNLGIMAACFPNLVSLNARGNCLEDVYPMISENVTTLDASGQRIDRIVELNVSNFSVENLAQQIPSILLYDHASQSYTRPLQLQISTYGFGLTLTYTDGKIGIKDVASQSEYRGTSGDILNVTALAARQSESNSTLKLKLMFEQGDANFLNGVDITDLQSTILYAFGDYPKYLPFNFTAADTYTDNMINVQDVVSTVNLLLSSPANSLPQANKIVKEQELAGNSDNHGMTWVEDGKIMLSIDTPVAAISIEMDSNAEINLADFGMTVVSNGTRSIIYSVTGGYIPAGERVIGHCKPYAVISRVTASTVEAEALDVMIADGTTTSLIGIEVDGSDCEIYTPDGIRLPEPRKGVNIIKYPDNRVEKFFIR